MKFLLIKKNVNTLKMYFIICLHTFLTKCEFFPIFESFKNMHLCQQMYFRILFCNKLLRILFRNVYGKNHFLPLSPKLSIFRGKGRYFEISLNKLMFA